MLRLIVALLYELPRMPRRIMLNSIAGSHWMPWPLRTAVYRALGLDIAWGSAFQPQVIFSSGTSLTVGAGTTINYRCFFDLHRRVVIGKNCGVGADVSFITGSHQRTNPKIRAGNGLSADITIGDGVWIGSGSMILPGARIGDGCVIAAKSVVLSDCESHTFYAGTPARAKQKLPV